MLNIYHLCQQKLSLLGIYNLILLTFCHIDDIICYIIDYKVECYEI